MLYHYRVTYNPMFSHSNLEGDGQKFIAGRVLAENPLGACEKLFEMFNTGKQPEGYRSMSVGDFVALRLAGQDTWFYYVCANQGWQAVHESEMITR